MWEWWWIQVIFLLIFGRNEISTVRIKTQIFDKDRILLEKWLIMTPKTLTTSTYRDASQKRHIGGPHYLFLFLWRMAASQKSRYCDALFVTSKHILRHLHASYYHSRLPITTKLYEMSLEVSIEKLLSVCKCWNLDALWRL